MPKPIERDDLIIKRNPRVAVRVVEVPEKDFDDESVLTILSLGSADHPYLKAVNDRNVPGITSMHEIRMVDGFPVVWARPSGHKHNKPIYILRPDGFMLTEYAMEKMKARSYTVRSHIGTPVRNISQQIGAFNFPSDEFRLTSTMKRGEKDFNHVCTRYEEGDVIPYAEQWNLIKSKDSLSCPHKSFLVEFSDLVCEELSSKLPAGQEFSEKEAASRYYSSDPFYFNLKSDSGSCGHAPYIRYEVKTGDFREKVDSEGNPIKQDKYTSAVVNVGIEGIWTSKIQASQSSADEEFKTKLTTFSHYCSDWYEKHLREYKDIEEMIGEIDRG